MGLTYAIIPACRRSIKPIYMVSFDIYKLEIIYIEYSV